MLLIVFSTIVLAILLVDGFPVFGHLVDTILSLSVKVRLDQIGSQAVPSLMVRFFDHYHK